MATIKRGKPPKATLSTLTGLGAERLAELLVAAARSDAALKRALTLEVASNPAEIDEEILRQIDRLRGGKGRLTAPRAITLGRELDRLLDALMSKLGQADPKAAAARLLDVLRLGPVLLARRTGEARPLVEVLSSVPQRFAEVLPRVEPASERARLIGEVYHASQEDRDAADHVMSTLIASVDAEARETLRSLIETDLAPLEGAPTRSSAALQEMYRQTDLLARLADAADDVDAFKAAQWRRDPRLRDHVAVAERLLGAGRAKEALELLEATPPGAVTASSRFKTLRIDVLEAAKRREDAQAERWRLFEAVLSADALRSYLKRLPDFEDVEREEAALLHAEQHPDTTAAVAFLAAWPSPRRAGALIRTRQAQLDGEAANALVPAAEALAYKDPLASTLLLRAVVDSILRYGRTAQFGQAGRLLVDCAGLAASIADWEGRPPHATYVVRLRNAYGRRKAFWRAAAAGA